MKQRKPHSKSRRGCMQCKRRHVKCDEQGPPCANCVVRKTECSYKDGPSSSAASLDPSSIGIHDLGGNASGSGSSLLLLPEDTIATTTGSSASSSIVSPSSASASTAVSDGSSETSEARKVLELELMHRWSTCTFHSLCSLPEDTHLMQTLLPREGLRHPFVLQGIFAVTALDLAINGSFDRRDSQAYTQAAMQYYSTTSAMLRAWLSDPNSPPDEYWLAFLVSSMAAVYHCAMPQVAIEAESNTSLGHIVGLFNLLNGATTLGLAHVNAILRSPMTSLHSIGIPDQSILDVETRGVLARLNSINDALHARDNPDEIRPDPPLGPLVDPEPLTAHETYRRAIHHLGSCFAEDARGVIRSYCSSYPGWNGKAFGHAVVAHDPMALVIIMHWGVLLDRLGKQMWWATSIGYGLVAELSDLLQHTDMMMLQEVVDAIAWTRRQVGFNDMIMGQEFLA
ncbi:hypothetical protein F5X68DRAFT_206614 [Plectosphaerella plurivora]|uniref:Zn(2)-C6 fungal-type domain-containing protein n=1 Tax=Plectosphaerella plurivora TaxID=936078 RepID=A0A9P8VD07_9PEZI|nr:hypothetical protein F5X68DRAFT_206614 [Plectosphaerella plurivora]